MQIERGSWWKFMARAVVLCAMIFGAVRLANARDGVAGGPARTSVTVAGTLTGVMAPTNAIFHFQKMGTDVCVSPAVPVNPDASNAFSVEVPIDTCPGVFDGSDVNVVVELRDRGTDAGVLTTIASTINPVPYAHFASQAGVNNDCPSGYARGTSDPAIMPSQRLCTRAVTLGTTMFRDEVVKVGTGGSAFWVDRYEATIRDTVDGHQLGRPTGGLGGSDADDIATSGLSRSGQHAPGDAPALALSFEELPTVNVTWFQANEACRAAGKRLPTGSEWLAAASGTVDDATCNVSSMRARSAASTNRCRSAWGAQDMIGNLGEWTDEWYASVAQVTSPTTTALGTNVMGIRVNAGLEPWPTSYGDGHDATTNITSTVWNDRDNVIGIPAAAVRGGNWSDGSRAGVFDMELFFGPSHWRTSIGFRCVIPR